MNTKQLRKRLQQRINSVSLKLDSASTSLSTWDPDDDDSDFAEGLYDIIDEMNELVDLVENTSSLDDIEASDDDGDDPDEEEPSDDDSTEELGGELSFGDDEYSAEDD